MTNTWLQRLGLAVRQILRSIYSSVPWITEALSVPVHKKDQLPIAEGVTLRRVEGLLWWPRLPAR
ncbi:hypothetical protein RHMOL_Rhmol10G0161000 [Rhododendron molle]|uniref:Uncharacterized protein n=1 Tax=Rhododendron molle TaxID=49168 RepID=A0ACC0M305_RHOML|nr:hypothetical protein RHMOL_Rhmol10G0161000 [Rhododendron molle]